MRFIRTIILTALAMTMASCGGDDVEKRAGELLEQARGMYEAHRYDEALRAIDSLRNTYPGAIEVRKQALSLYQTVSLEQAQEDLAHTDSLMQIVNGEYERMKAKVERDKQELKATYEEMERLNLARVRLDSLKVRFDMQCAKIKYIHKKQKE